jgi:nucleoside-triphosphatase
MNKHMFLQGDIGVGKSTIIKNAILPHINEIGGCFTQRIFIGQRYVGFALNSILDKQEYNVNRYVKSLKDVENIFLYSDDDGKWHSNSDVFLNCGISYLRRGCSFKKLIILDELGGIELKCVPFMNEVIRILDGDTSVLGVLKSRTNITKLQNKLKYNNENMNGENFFYNRIQNHHDVEMVEVNKESYNNAKEQVNKFVRELFHD